MSHARVRVNGGLSLVLTHGSHSVTELCHTGTNHACRDRHTHADRVRFRGGTQHGDAMAARCWRIYSGTTEQLLTVYTGTPTADVVAAVRELFGFSDRVPLRFRGAHGVPVALSSHLPDKVCLHVAVEAGLMRPPPRANLTGATTNGSAVSEPTPGATSLAALRLGWHSARLAKHRPPSLTRPPTLTGECCRAATRFSGCATLTCKQPSPEGTGSAL